MRRRAGMAIFFSGSVTQTSCSSFKLNVFTVSNSLFSDSYFKTNLPINLMWAMFFKLVCNTTSMGSSLPFKLLSFIMSVFQLLPIYYWMSEDKGPSYPSNRWLFLLVCASVLTDFLWNAARSVEQSRHRHVWKNTMKEENVFKCVRVFVCTLTYMHFTKKE